MPDILSVCLQDILHSRKPVLRTEEIIHLGIRYCRMPHIAELVGIFIVQTLLPGSRVCRAE